MNADDLLTRIRLHLRAVDSSLAELSMFAEVRWRDDLGLAATDGESLFFHPARLGALDREQQVAVFCHTLLHAALLHPLQNAPHHGRRWNLACDIALTGLVASAETIALPAGTRRFPDIEHLGADEILCLLPHEVACNGADDLLPPPPGSQDRLRAYWEHALRQSIMASTPDDEQPTSWRPGVLLGKLLRRQREGVGQIDWRTRLWRSIVTTPTDYGEFDHRHFWRGLYVEQLAVETVVCNVAIDTSGSIGDMALQGFLGEVRAIAQSYPHVQCRLFYVDTAVYGPYQIERAAPLPPPIGGGGTDFRPLFAAIRAERLASAPPRCIFLTDGYGVFPDPPPPIETLWVVTPGGIDLDAIPFGEAVRLRPQRSER